MSTSTLDRVPLLDRYAVALEMVGDLETPAERGALLAAVCWPEVVADVAPPAVGAQLTLDDSWAAA